MQKIDKKQEWEQYCDSELDTLSPILKDLGFELEKRQPHIIGERFLMQAVTTESGRKLILLAQRKEDGKRVVIKATSNPAGACEIDKEHERRRAMRKIDFAYNAFPTPQELNFIKRKNIVISIQEFIEQETAFTKRDTKEQFMLALDAFKTQESIHATTHKHKRQIEKIFDEKNAADYITAFKKFRRNIVSTLKENEGLNELLEQAANTLAQHKETVEQYCRFLTHTDFVPHNFRVLNGKIYFLDLSSVRFGNKYEGWARFVNFMALYNPKLEAALLKYVKNNRAQGEYLSLKLMRIYRLGEIIWFYTSLLDKTSGDLHELTKLRVQFWADVLDAVLRDKQVERSIVETYKQKRDNLRSDEEKERQVGLH